MVDRYLFPKFGINSFSGIRENDVYGWRTDGRATTDAHMTISKAIAVNDWSATTPWLLTIDVRLDHFC